MYGISVNKKPLIGKAFYTSAINFPFKYLIHIYGPDKKMYNSLDSLKSCIIEMFSIC